MKGLIIFDVGGVFRDSSLAMNEGFRRGFESAGSSYPFKPHEVWHLRGIGKYNSSFECAKALFAIQKSGKVLEEFMNTPDAETVLDGLVLENISPEEMAIVEKIKKIYKDYFKSPEAKNLVVMFDFCEEALEQLSKKYLLAIFSNSSRHTLERDLGKFAHFFSVVLGEESVTKPKPSGEGILKVMKLSGYFDKSRVFYVGDSIVDIIAAKDAGVKSVAVLSGMSLKKDLEKAKPDYLFENILEMAENI